MKALFVCLILTGTAAFAAPTDPCSLSPALLSAYDGSAPSPRSLSATRQEMSDFMSRCALGPVDNQSRVVFFNVLDREFHFDFAPVFATMTPGEREAAEEGIVGFQRRLSQYLDSVIRPDDVRFKPTVLFMGSGSAIAALGPPVKTDVVKMATNPDRRQSGFRASPHYLQAAAFDALGIWIDPAERRFNAKEKAEFTSILRGALDASDGVVKPGMHHVLVLSVVRALGNSDDPAAATTLRKFADRSEKGEQRRGEIYENAQKAAADVDRHARKRG